MSSSYLASLVQLHQCMQETQMLLKIVHDMVLLNYEEATRLSYQKRLLELQKIIEQERRRLRNYQRQMIAFDVANLETHLVEQIHRLILETNLFTLIPSEENLTIDNVLTTLQILETDQNHYSDLQELSSEYQRYRNDMELLSTALVSNILEPDIYQRHYHSHMQTYVNLKAAGLDSLEETLSRGEEYYQMYQKFLESVIQFLRAQVSQTLRETLFYHEELPEEEKIEITERVRQYQLITSRLQRFLTDSTYVSFFAEMTEWIRQIQQALV